MKTKGPITGWVLIIALVFASPALPVDFIQNSRVVDFSRVDLYPLLQLHNSQHSHVVNSLAPPDMDFVDDLFISRGGATIAVSVSRLEGGLESDPVELETSILRGIASKEALTRLKKAITGANLGIQKDCAYQSLLKGEYQITWYGQNGRRNQFSIHFDPAVPEALEPCPEAMDRLLDAVVQYEAQLRADAGSEVIKSK